MLTISLIFSLVILVSFQKPSTGAIAGAAWATFCLMIFNTPTF